jgi:prolyl oligopeptidase
VLAEVRNGDGGEIAWYLRQTDGRWDKVADFNDGLKQAALGDDGHLYAMSIKDAALGRIIAIPLATPTLANARVIVPETDIVAEHVQPTRSRLYVAYRAGGPSAVRMFDLSGKALGELPAEPNSDIHIGERLRGDDAGAHHELCVAADLVPFRCPAASSSPPSSPDVIHSRCTTRSSREFAVSKDGTRIPINVVARKGTPRDGRNPVILYGYGGYGISMQPFFSPMTRLWLDYGGIYAVANVRGGGEFGEPWHEAGKLTRKQNVFDDFIASMAFLVEQKYTSADRLAIMGGSNGGLLMGAALTQQPQAMRAVVSMVGIYDALRWELQSNGAFNTTEFGSVKDPDQFKALYAYSPFTRVRDGVPYPAVLFTAGDNDGRVALRITR